MYKPVIPVENCTRIISLVNQDRDMYKTIMLGMCVILGVLAIYCYKNNVYVQDNMHYILGSLALVMGWIGSL